MALSEPIISPSRDTFCKEFSAGRPQMIWTRLVADTETPVSAMLKLHKDDAPGFLLESVEGGEVRGRYSIIGLAPDIIWRSYGERAEMCTDPASGVFLPSPEPVIPSLQRLLRAIRADVPEGLPPMAAGLIGYLGYDMIKRVETIPSANPDPLGIPDACLMRPGIMLIFDGRDGVMYVIVPVWQTHASASKNRAEELYEKALGTIRNVLDQLGRPLEHAMVAPPAAGQALSSAPVPQTPAVDTSRFTSNYTEPEYAAMVEKAKEYIRAGDIFQVVLSQRFESAFEAPPFALYRALRFLNPSPFLFYLRMQGFSLVGSSPEILVRVRNKKITIRPIAGTRKRGKTMEEDLALEKDLLADPKEVA